MPETLEQLYEQMYQLTHNHCGCEEKHQFGCCTQEHCENARRFAQEKYGIELKPTGHPIPFMSESGCVVAPHLRPICTLHSCHISYSDKAKFPDDPQRTKQYFYLRELILAESRAKGMYPWMGVITGA